MGGKGERRETGLSLEDTFKGKWEETRAMEDGSNKWEELASQREGMGSKERVLALLGIPAWMGQEGFENWLRRSDVVTVTPWLAPIVWEGTFDPLLIDAIYRPMNFSIAATVFAVGKYIRFLKDFLETAEEHFMVGFKVHYHIFTDQPDEVPQVSMGDGRNISVHHIAKLNRWQDISSSRMRIIQNLIEEQVHREADYIFCLDVDTKFHFRWGAEALDQLVAQIHPWFYDMSRNQFTYERRPISTAYIPQDKGDFYYIGAMFGGMVEDVHRLVQTCCRNLEADSANGIEAAWQEESHLNWYLLYNKPSKVLSPEYLWHDQRGRTEVMKVIRLSQIIKNNAEVRENV
ncbi:Globoside alpha-1,3-N-acetylgalactosaminyltransferase 1-like [Scleropages formosus]|uniref:Globoside alpha-1,3-N-acetylgalactosaminyltransferase 1-like n=1 Tax=Scleropages formosus TaxID=113540 RepID=A0A0P7TWP2_SCLFO|nr:Globoside alpha-1,3-N-acetylgalactosaminyltransferase 1-like [Scleropages formosus]